jgi:hypothetical protein
VSPEKTKHQMRVELGRFEEMAAEMFALVVFPCDGLLEIKEENSTGAGRFFRMAKLLPIEVQMILCFRVVGSAYENIPAEQRGDGLQGTREDPSSVNTKHEVRLGLGWYEESFLVVPVNSCALKNVEEFLRFFPPFFFSFFFSSFSHYFLSFFPSWHIPVPLLETILIRTLF